MQFLESFNTYSVGIRNKIGRDKMYIKRDQSEYKMLLPIKSVFNRILPSETIQSSVLIDYRLYLQLF